MKQIKNKILSVILSVVIALTPCAVALLTKAQEKTINVNIELLDSLLRDRSWIIESIVSGDIQNNPYAIANPSSTAECLLYEVLENYKNNAAFKALVDAMDVYANTGQYLNGFTDDVLSTFEGWFGDSAAANKIVASTDELKYESILNEVIKTDYTASWGDTLFEENMELENLKQRGKLLKKLNTYQTALKDAVGLYGSDSSAVTVYEPYGVQTETYEIDLAEYVNHFLSAYQQDLETYLNSTISIPAVDGNESLKKKVLSAGALGLLSAYERTVLPASNYDLDDLYYDGMFESTMQILNGTSKVLKVSDKAMDYAILLEALQSQKNSTVQVMNRISNNTGNDDLSKVLNNYAALVRAAGNKKTLAYEVVTNYLRNETAVTNIIKKETGVGAQHLVEQSVQKYSNAKLAVLSGGIAKSVEIANIVVWVADETTGIEQTAKKIFECKYLKKIIDEAVKTYKTDLASYQSNKTDENAEKVLTDLDFIKALRLYGEKAAYGAMSAQMESLIGEVLGGGMTKEYLDRRYQSMVDAFLGCTFNPVSNHKLVLSSGDVLNIMNNDDAKKTPCAQIKKSNGTTLYFAEADTRLMGGIALNGATVNIYESASGIYLPLITNAKDGAQVNIYCDNVAFGTINNGNSAQMTIEVKKADKTFSVTDSIENAGKLTIKNSLASSKIPVCDLTNQNELSLVNCVLQCKGTLKNDGTVNGMVDVCGGKRDYENAYYTVGSQLMGGTGTYTDLYFTSTAKQGVKIAGTQTVTNYISNPNCRLRTGENIVLTGSCGVANNKLKSAVTLKAYSSTSDLVFDNLVRIIGDVELYGKCRFNDTLYLADTANQFTLHDETNVKGDFIYDGGSIVGGEKLRLYNNVDINTSSPSLTSLLLVGKVPQTIHMANPMTVTKLQNYNTSVGGVTFDDIIKVSAVLDSGGISNYTNSENIVLTGNACVSDHVMKGNISAENWTCTESLQVSGTLNAAGTINLTNAADVTAKQYKQSGGTLTVGENSTLYCEENFIQTGKTVNEGTIFIGEDGKIASTFSGGTLKAKGDLMLTGDFAANELILDSKLPQKFENSLTTNIKNLTIKNDSRSGVEVNSKIYVSGAFSNQCKNLVHGENIILSGDAAYVVDGVTKNDLALSGQYTLKAGETLTVYGTLSLLPNATLSVQNDAKLLVVGDIRADSASVSVESGGSVYVQGHSISKSGTWRVDGSMRMDEYLDSSSDAWNIGGDVTVKEDTKITSSTVGGNGVLRMMGDLMVSSGTWNKPNIAFISKLPQNVSGSSISVNQITIENRSKSGITFDSTVYYYGNCINDDSMIVNPNKMIAKS